MQAIVKPIKYLTIKFGLAVAYLSKSLHNKASELLLAYFHHCQMCITESYINLDVWKIEVKLTITSYRY